jgi:exodeoxyribonuclease-3
LAAGIAGAYIITAAHTRNGSVRFSIATWNINSVRLRLDLVTRFLTDEKPDVLCLQETKCPDGQFPTSEFKALGYKHIAINGQKGYHARASTGAISAPREILATSP